MTQLPEGGVVVTIADIYRQLVSLTTRVDASLARQEQAGRIIAEHEAQLRPLVSAATQLTDHETRLRVIERSRWPLASLTVLLGLGSLIVAAAALYAK